MQFLNYCKMNEQDLGSFGQWNLSTLLTSWSCDLWKFVTQYYSQTITDMHSFEDFHHAEIQPKEFLFLSFLLYFYPNWNRVRTLWDMARHNSSIDLSYKYHCVLGSMKINYIEEELQKRNRVSTAKRHWDENEKEKARCSNSLSALNVLKNSLPRFTICWNKWDVKISLSTTSITYQQPETKWYSK